MSGMHIIVVGGFLGAGKTTLLAQAAKLLTAQGKRVGIITNDQAADLVDTHYLSGPDITVREVAGGCFCCRFKDLESAAEDLLEKMRPDVLLSEPVGSCTDISATVLQPMKQKWGGWAKLSQFSVLADPRRLREVFDPDRCRLPKGVLYIIKKQFEEADCIVINKIDLLSPEELSLLKGKVKETWPGIKIFEMSALNNQGVGEWLSAVIENPAGGHKIIDVDYDLYASGEAELGWLNTSITLVAKKDTDWEDFARKLIKRIHGDFKSLRAEIGHLKLLLSSSNGHVLANATSIGENPTVRGSMGKSAGTVSLIINARVLLDPEVLQPAIKHSILVTAGINMDVSELSLHCFKPAYPSPTYRMDKIIDQVAGRTD